MDAVLCCLTYFDSVQLLVYALETQVDSNNAPLVRFFLPPRSKTHYDQLCGSKNASDDLERCYRMRWMDTFRPYSFPSDVVYAASRTGDLQVLQWLHHMPTRYEAHVAMQHAAHSRNLGMVQWIAETACAAPTVGVEVPFKVEMLIPLDEVTGIMAWCVHNHQEKRIERFFASRLRGLAPRSLMYHHSSSKLYDPVHYAVCEGDIELLKLLHETRATYNWDFSVASVIKAAEKGHLKIVQWLVKNEESAQDPALVSSIMKAAIEAHHLHIIEWLYKSKIDADSTLFDVNDPEVRNGPKQWVYGNFQKTHHPLLKLQHTEAEKLVAVAKWFHCHKGLGVIPTMLPAFLVSGNFDDVKWLLARINVGTNRERPVFIAPHQLANACFGNNLDVVKYFVEDCGIWADEALRLSMQRGFLTIAKYLYGTGNQNVVLEHEISIAVGQDQA
uniref:Ankyrin repeat-containing domain n=1 Tax=Globisporangium ultimum (strain ATCC 200006 / CBS 805.95 / DAOM BR144) TaxID=431595 RepID=K3X9A1_GLOUD